MGNEVKQKFTIQGVVDVKDVIQGIDQIKGELGKLSLGPGLQSEFDKLFQRIEKNSEKANEAMASGFKNKEDVKRYTNAMDQIGSAYDSIITKAKILSNNNKINLKVDDAAIKSLNSEMETLQNNISQAKDSLRTLKASTGRDMGNIAKKYKGGADSWNNAVQAFKDGDIQKTDNAIKILENTIKVAQTKAQKGGKALSSEWLQKIEDVEALRAALENYKNAQNNIKTSEGELAQKEKELNNIMAKGSALLAQTANVGEQGAQAFRSYARESVDAAKSTQQLNSELEHFKSKAAYFFGLSNAINLFKRAVRSAYDTVKDLDAVMTETAVVTNFDVGDMWEQLPEYTQRANELGVSIHSAYEAATIFYQQGLKTNEVMAVSNETLKMARIAGLDAATASDRMTNALRGFNMEMDELSAKRVNDVYSKLAAITASNTDEISTAMTKVASLAHNANMEFETTSAFLAQMIETTRESAETAGTALKTVVARFSEVKKLYSKGELMGQDEEGGEIDVNKVSTALRSAGIDLNEYLTGAKGLDDIFIELASKWDSLDKVQQRYIATMAAGSRQQSRFIAMMSDYGRTMELVDAANNANGASQEQYAKTLESLQTKLSRLKNAWDEFILGLANSDVIKGAVDKLTDLITAINTLIKKVSGKNAGAKMVTSFFAAFTAFKIGSKLTGSSNPIVQMLSAFAGSGKMQIAGTAQSVADLFVGDFKKNVLKGAKNKLDNNSLFKYFFKNTTTKYSVSDMSALRTGIGQQISAEGVVLDNEGKQAISEAINSGEINKVNEALRQQGVQFQINEKNARQFGVTAQTVADKNTNSYKLLSAAITAVGAGMMIVGDMIAAQGEDYESLGYFIKTLGSAMMVVGTIMSVVLPIKAQIMSTGISAAISSIPIVGWIAAIIAALAALGAAFLQWHKSQAFEAKMKKANDACKQAADAADEAAKAYEELGKAWDSLQDKYDAINQAAEGTQKWRDAIREANDEVLKLVETYTELEVVVGKDGVLEVSEESKKLVEENLRNAKNMTQAASYGAQMYRTQLKKEKTETDWSGTNLTGRGDTWKIDGIDYNEDKVKEKVVEAYKNGQIHSVDQLKTFVDQFLPEEQRNDPNIKSPINKYGFESLKSYVNDSELVKAAESHINGVISSSLTKMGDKESINLGKNFISTDIAKKVFDAQLEKVGANRNLSEKQEEFAKNSGYANYEEWKEKANSGKEIAEHQLNYQLAMQRTQQNTDKFVEDFEGRISNLTPEQRKLFEEAEGGALTSEEIDELRKQKDEIYKSLGGDEAFANLDMNQDGFNKYLDSILDTASKNAGIKIAGIGEELVSDLTSGARKSLDENLKSVFTASGKEGRDKITGMINELTKGLDSDSKKGFMKSLSQIDWTSANSVRSLSELAKEYGISEDAVNDLEQQIIELNNAATKIDLKNVTTQLKSLLGLGKKINIGEQGRNFSEEQKNQLVEAGIDSSKFVYNVQTGEYNYTGVLDDILKAINDQTDKMVDTSQLEKDVVSGTAAKEMWDKGTPDTNEDKIAFIRDYMLKAGDSSKISKDMLQVASYMAKGGNFSVADKLIKIIENEKDALPERQNELDNVGLEKEVMKRQLQYGFINAQDANNGDKEAQKALLAQISGTGLSEDLKQRFLTNVSNGNREDITRAGNIVDTFDQAKANGISVEDLNAYADALQRVQGLQDKQTDELYAMALAEAKYNAGMKSLTSSYDDWSKLIKKGGGFVIPQPDTDDFKVYEKMKEDVAKMLNSSEKIPDEFFKSKKNAELLQKAVKGSRKAATALAVELARINIGKTGKESIDNQISNYLDVLQKQLPNLKIGTTFDDSSAAMGLAKLLSESGKTVDEVNKIMGNLGIGMEWKTEEVDIGSIQKTNSTGYQEIVHADGTKEKVPVESLNQYANNGKVRVLIPKKGTFNKPPKMTPPKDTKKKSKGGGGKKSKAKKERWENPYDELYNLQEKINESLRKREALERRYQKLLKQEQSSLSDIRKSYYDQIKQIRTEANFQKELEAGRRRQINNIGKQTYVDSKGKVKTFDQMGVTKYAKYNFETGEIEMDWAGIQALEGSKNVEKGKAVEAYVSKLEELVQSYEGVRDKLWELEDKIEEFREAAIDSYLSFEDRVMDALVNHYQKEIDSYQAMSDAIDKVNNEVISSLREQIDLSRQIRDNTEKEEDISKKENRLAYLQRDTSGANDLEILSLQKELKDAREGYADTLVDQTIDKLQKDADQASEQRQRQIETMQAQLDIAKETGALWQEVYTLMSDASKSEIFSEDSELAKLLKDGEAFKALSNIGQKNWWAEVGKAFREAIIGRDEAEDKFKTDANNDGTIANTGTSQTLKDIAESNTQANVTPDEYTRTDKEAYGVALAIATNYGKNYGGWGKTLNDRKAHLKEKGFDPEGVTKTVSDLAKEKTAWDNAQKKKKKKNRKSWNWKNNSYGITSLTGYTMSKFATGGLADRTGPAWLDGTKTKPELVLNAQDTRNFIALKDILASLMNTQKAKPSVSSGDNYFDINIQADIGSDYDVDKLASRIKKIIFEDGQYRNVNTINYLR